MKIGKSKFINYLFYLEVVITLIMIFITNIIVKSANFYVYALFAIEIAVIATPFLLYGEKLKLKKNEILFVVVFVASQCISFLWFNLTYNIGGFDIHKAILFAGMVVANYFVANKIDCNYNTFEKMIDFFIVSGIVACVFNLIVNSHYFSLGNLSVIMHYTWNFKSFFFTRATYGIYVSVCAIAALYRSEKKGKLGYLLIYVFLVANVLVTAARAQMLAIIGASIIYLSYSKKYRKFVIFGSAILVALLIIIGASYFSESFSNIMNTYSIFFDHSKGGQTDISTGRFYLWSVALQNNDLFTFFFGHGLGSKDVFLTINKISVLNEVVMSFHSGYVDLFFETGIFGLSFLAVSILGTLKNVKNNCRKDIKHFIFAIFSIWALVNVADSNMLPYSTDMFTPFATFIVVVLPNAIANYEKKLAQNSY